MNCEAQTELNLFVGLSNYTVALALQYDDNDFVVAHFSVTQLAWNLRHSKQKCLLELGNFLLASAWRHRPQMLTYYSLLYSLLPTTVTATTLRTVPLAENRRWYHCKYVWVIRLPQKARRILCH